MTELEKLGLSIIFLVSIFTFVWSVMMLHDDLRRISIKQDKTIKLLEGKHEQDGNTI